MTYFKLFVWNYTNHYLIYNLKLIHYRDELAIIARYFQDVTNLRNVIGAIDDIHIRIKAPRENEHLFVNRKGDTV